MRQPAFRFPLAAMCVAGFTLAGCAAGNTAAKLSAGHNSFTASHNSFQLALPEPNAPHGSVPVVLPRACPPELRAGDPGEPVLPLDAFYPAPETAAAQAPADRYNAYLQTLGTYIKGLQHLVGEGQEACR